MRKFSRALLLAVLALLTSVVLGVASAFMASLALGVTALMVPGTGTPNADIVANYREHAADRYIAPFTGSSCTSTNFCNLDGIEYPASFWPLFFIGNWCPGLQCDKWDASVGTGVQKLDTALRFELANNGEPIIIFGYSQGGAVVSNELRNIGDLTPAQRSRLSVVMIGNAFNPDGGFFTRLGFLGHVPLLDVTFGLATPVDTGVPMTAIGFQYDPVMYAPRYWGNPFALLNALAAFENVHGYYLTPNGNGPTDPIAYGYTEAELAEQLDPLKHPENFRKDSEGNVYVMIPAKSLPIVDLVMSVVPSPLRPVVKPVADLVSPVLKVLIDLGYDWSGDPGVARPLSLLPFNPIQNWPAVGVKLVVATMQGIQAFIDDLGGLATTIAPSTPAPLTTTTVSTLAATSAPAAKTATLATEQVSEAKTSPPSLTVVKDLDTTVQQTAVEKDTTSASTDESPVTTPESTADDTKSDETKADDKKTDVTKAGTDTDKKADTHKKDADSAKAAA